MTKSMAEVLARALYVSAHWQDTITEHDDSRQPQAEYERRAGEKWDAGNAGWSRYQLYPRLAEAGAAALSAAGFGLVADAWDEAWDEGRAHGARFPFGFRGLATDDNPYRKASNDDQ